MYSTMSTRVNNFLCLTFALAIRRSASQVLTVTPPCIPDKAEVILRCQTDNFNNAILFFLGATNNGGCDGGACSSSGTAGYIPSQSGSLYTYMTITEYNDSRDGGVWTCNDGGVSSNGYSLQLGNCGSSGSPDNTNRNIGIGVGIGITVAIVVTLAIVLYRKYLTKGPSFAPQQPLAIEFTSSDFVQISWKRPPNVNQIKYHIDAESMPSNESLSLAKDILDTQYDVKISKLRGSKVRFSVKSESNYVVSKPLFSQQYLLLGEQLKPNGPLQVELQNKQCIISWQVPIHGTDYVDYKQIKYRIDVLLQGSSNWKNIKDNVVELTCSVDLSNMKNKSVLFRVIAECDNDISVPLIAEENFYIDPKHFE